MAEVKWIKLATGLPDNKKIKQIRKLPQGDTIALLWVFLMCLAGETNDEGAVYFIPEIPYTDEMLADQFGMDVNTVRLGLATFQRFGMIEIVDDIIHLEAWEKWQSVDKLSEIREKTRKRVAKHREKKRLAAGNADCNVTGNVTVTLGNAVDIDIDSDKEEEKEDREEDKKIYIDVIAYLNEKAGTKYRASGEKTKKLIRARLAEGFTLEDFKTVIDNKCADWLNTDYAKFLRPETLFSPKFEGYLNQRGVGKHGRSENAAATVGSSVGTWV